jgi:DNA-directed RNA polymerase specialized sigma24 family protein
MTVSAAIAPHLPYLRRFARALTGSQQGGDAYVVETLESIVASPESIRSADDPRVALYRNFLKIWNSVTLNGTTSVPAFDGQAATVDRSLEQITPLPRQAFLLASLEGFSTEHVSTILGMPMDEVGELISRAGREIAAQVATDVLIIEDEPLIAIDLEDLVQGLGHRVTGMARTHREAVVAALGKRPGLVLADIQLADGSSGLEAVNEILGACEVPVIFITAFPERLLTGVRPEPTFLITKPFDTNMVRAIVSQALFFGTRATLPTRRGVTA